LLGVFLNKESSRSSGWSNRDRQTIGLAGSTPSGLLSLGEVVAPLQLGGPTPSWSVRDNDQARPRLRAAKPGIKLIVKTRHSGINPRRKGEKMKKIESKHLKGLTFRYSEGKKVKTEGGPDRIEYTAKERDLTPLDVLSWKDNGNEISLVAADGRKHVIPIKENKVRVAAN